MDKVITPTVEVVAPPTEDTSRDNATFTAEYTDNSYKALLGHFGLEDNEGNQKSMKTIWDYASKMAKSTNKDDVIWQVVKLTHKIGQGGNTMDHVKLTNYITAWKRMEDAERVVKEMENA